MRFHNLTGTPKTLEMAASDRDVGMALETLIEKRKESTSASVSVSEYKEFDILDKSENVSKSVFLLRHD